MKIIFSYADGVFNRHKYLANATLADIGIYKDLDKSRLEMLKVILQKTNAKLVLTFSWGESFTDSNSNRLP